MYNYTNKLVRYGPMGVAIGQMADQLKKVKSLNTSAQDTGLNLVNGKITGTSNVPLAKPTPSYAQFKTPGYNLMTDAQALSKAQTQLRPQYMQQLTNAGERDKQQRNLTAQMLNARGQNAGGPQIESAINNRAILQNQLTNIDTQNATQTQGLADQYLARDREERARQISEAYQQWQANYGVQRDQVADQRYADETAYKKSVDARDWNRTKVLDNRDAQQYQDQLRYKNADMFGYLVDPKTGKKMTTLEGQRFNLATQKEARIATGGSKSGGKRSSSGSTGTYKRKDTVTAIKGTLDEIKGYQEGIDAGATREELLADFAQYKDQWGRLGYDLNAIINAINKAPTKEYQAFHLRR